MFHICGEHGSPLSGNDHLFLMKLRDTHQRQEMLTGPCEDDYEITAPYIGICPDESAHPHGSPLCFGGITHAEARVFDDQMAQFMAQGFDGSIDSDLIDYRLAHDRDPYTGDLMQ